MSCQSLVCDFSPCTTSCLSFTVSWQFCSSESTWSNSAVTESLSWSDNFSSSSVGPTSKAYVRSVSTLTSRLESESGWRGDCYVQGSCFCCTEAWSVLACLVGLIGEKNGGLTVSTALDGVTFSGWKVGSTKVLATNIDSNQGSLSDHLVSLAWPTGAGKKINCPLGKMY